MCLKIKLPWPMPEETKRIGRKLLKENDVYRLIGDQLFERWNEDEYADLYSAEEKDRRSHTSVYDLLSSDSACRHLTEEVGRVNRGR